MYAGEVVTSFFFHFELALFFFLFFLASSFFRRDWLYCGQNVLRG